MRFLRGVWGAAAPSGAYLDRGFSRFWLSLLVVALLAWAGALPVAKAEEVKTGGRFILWDYYRNVVTDQDFRGKFLLIFFGYTYCPDVCPTTLQEISEVMDILGDKGKDVQPLFISVDPERDTPKVLREYLSNFHKKILGLTGTKVAIESVTKKFRVRYEKVESKPGDPDYTVDHTAAVFFMGPQGEYLGRFGYGTPAKKIAEIVLRRMAEYKR